MTPATPFTARGVVNHLSGVALCVCAFQTVRDAREDGPRTTAPLLSLTCCATTALAVLDAGKRPSPRLVVDAASLLLVSAVLAPVLGTLTAAYATNTVEALVAAAFAVHLCAMDLRHEIAPVPMNAAFAAVLLLASRVRSSLDAFAFAVSCALVLLTAQTARPTSRATPAVLASAAALGCAATLGWRECAAFLAAVWVVSVPCCAALDRTARTRTPLVGPWDQLRVREEEEQGVQLVGARDASPA